MSLRPFHLAFPVDDLDAARAFYGGVIGCREGRSSEHWIDFDFFGHQIVAHLCSPSGGNGTGPLPHEEFSPPSGGSAPARSPSRPPIKDTVEWEAGRGSGLVPREGAGSSRPRITHTNVDSDHVPVPHFGLVLRLPDFEALAQRLADAGVAFVIPPRVRFKGKPGEQHTMFLTDPAGNALEFKAFADDAMLFDAG